MYLCICILHLCIWIFAFVYLYFSPNVCPTVHCPLPLVNLHLCHSYPTRTAMIALQRKRRKEETFVIFFPHVCYSLLSLSLSLSLSLYLSLSQGTSVIRLTPIAKWCRLFLQLLSIALLLMFSISFPERATGTRKHFLSYALDSSSWFSCFSI